MDLQEFTGMNYLETPADEYYSAVVEKIGLDAIMQHVPFSMMVLREAYAKDKAFNTAETPLSRWDAATGMRVMPNNQVQTVGGGIRGLLAVNGVTTLSMGECVCVLKQAAELAVLREAKNA